MSEQYDPKALQEKWQPRWEELDPFRAEESADDPRPRKYLLDMFPYPSGDLHMGHGEAFAIADVLARYWFHKGYNVLHPIGWDSFGLPAENAAIKRNAHPAEWTYSNIDTQAASFRRYGISFDWSRRLHTSDPEYYRWNQWLFLRFYERGLAYRKDGLVNWCPKDQTVLANEQVINGRCERCGTEVVRRKLTQWYFKITEYAQRLLDDMAQLEGGWPERVLTMQRNWIGRSTGADVQFRIEGREEPVTVFTTRPDTLYGATFFVIAADSPLAEEVVRPGPAGRPGGVPGRGGEALRHRAAVHREGEDRRLPRHLRDQPGERRAHPGVGGRLRARRLRPRRDHGGARARPARPRLRAEVRAAGAGRGRHRRARPGRDRHRHPGRGHADQLRPAERAEQVRGDRQDHRDPGGAGHRQGRGQLPAARLAGLPAAVLGHADPDHPLPGLRRGPGAGRPAPGHPARPARRGARARRASPRWRRPPTG